MEKRYLDLFKREAKDLVTKMEDSLLELEKSPENIDPINEFFRGAHSIKGMAASMSFNNISELTHAMENLMAVYRSGVKPGEEEIELLFRYVDKLREMIEKAGTEKLTKMDAQPLIEDIKERTEKIKEKVKEKEVEKEAGEKEKKAEKGGGEEQLIREKILPKIKRIETIKLNVKFLDNLMDLVGELLINKNRLQMIASKSKIKEFDDAFNQLSMLLDDLQKEVFEARLLPLDQIFEQFPRVIRDLARAENKRIELKLQGGGIEIDKAILDSLSEPLIHLIRNAVDHGVEKPQERKRAGKNEMAKIWIRAKRGENSIIVEVEDDGKGVDIEKIKQKGLKKELIKEEAAKEEILNLMFVPGFSGSDRVTKVSGRGVGMDVVREVVESLKGSVSIKTQAGKGTKISLVFPFTTAISKALVVEAKGNKYGILLDDIQSTINLERAKIRRMENRRVVLLRDAVAPLINIHQLFTGVEEEEPAIGGYGIIIQDENRIAVIAVEDIVSQQELVVRPLPAYLGSVRFFSGTAILGDGTVILTLNPASILSSGKS